MLTSTREMQDFRSSGTRSLIFRLMLPRTAAVDAAARKAGGAGVAPAEGASPPVPRRRTTLLSVWLSLTKLPSETGTFESHRHGKRRVQVFCTKRCVQKKKSPVNHLLFLKGNYQEFIWAHYNSLHLNRPNIKY